MSREHEITIDQKDRFMMASTTSEMLVTIATNLKQQSILAYNDFLVNSAVQSIIFDRVQQDGEVVRLRYEQVVDEIHWY